MWTVAPLPRAELFHHSEDPDAAQRARLAELFSTDRERVQLAPSYEREATKRCRLYEYAFEPTPFRAWTEAEGQWVSSTEVRATRVTPLGDLEAHQLAAGVDLRWTEDLAAARDQVLSSGLPFSIVRYRNYQP